MGFPGGVLGLVGLLTWFAAMVVGLVVLGLWLMPAIADRGAQKVGSTTAEWVPPPPPVERTSGSLAGKPPVSLPRLMYAHFPVAIVGLLIWLLYVFSGSALLARVALAFVLFVAVVGVVLYLRSPDHRLGLQPDEARRAGHLPVSAVAIHGALGALTVVLVVVAALTVGLG